MVSGEAENTGMGDGLRYSVYVVRLELVDCIWYRLDNL